MKLLCLLFTLSVFAPRVGAFSDTGDNNVAIYWGQNSVGQTNSQQNLAYYCQSNAADIVLVSFLDVFFDTGGLPQINLGPSCDGPNFPGTDLLQCPAVGTDIQVCQSLGKKVLLSLGGAAGLYGFTSAAQASQFADTVWNVFGGGTSATRPFGSAVLDGFDLDIEGGSNQYYDVFVTQMRTHYASDPSKKYYISGAPQCPLPDYMLNQAMTSSDFDFFFVQFYNNYCGMGAYGTSNFNFDAWDQFAKNQSKNPNAKVYLGVPGSSSAAGSGYVNAAQVVSVAQALQSKYTSFGGVSIWDASQAWANNNFAGVVKQGLGSGSSGASSSSTLSTLVSSKTTSITTTASSSSTSSTSASSKTMSSTATTSTSKTAMSTTGQAVSTSNTASVTTMYSSTTAAATSAAATGTFSPSANTNVAVYWGQTSGQQNLAYYCRSSATDILVISSLDVFFGPGGLPVIDLSSSCQGPAFAGTGLLSCPAVGADIQTCQSLGKKVMLSLGGSGSYGFTSADQARQFADTVWNLFGGGTSNTRPFGAAVVDGFDLDVMGGSNQYYDVFVNQMRSHYASDVSKKYYISGAPQCPLPDYMLNQAMTTSDFDFYFVQFYNNYCGVNAYGTGNFNFDAWDQFVKTQSENRNAKVYLGVLGSSGGLSGYVSANNVVSIAQALQSKYPGTFGGVSVWDAAQAWANGDFAGVVKQGLVSGGAASSASSDSAVTTQMISTTTAHQSSSVPASSRQTAGSSSTQSVAPSTDSHTTSASLTTSHQTTRAISTSVATSTSGVSSGRASTSAVVISTTVQPSYTSTAGTTGGHTNSASTSAAATGSFSPSADTNVAVYWGQTSGQQNLAYYCRSSATDILVISSLDVFFGPGGLPVIDLSSSCQGPAFAGTGLLSCPAVGADIQTCQSLGKKVMLSLGGSGSYGFTSADQARQFADTVWNLFGGGTSNTRPFGAAVVDGFDLDVMGGSNQYYDVFVNQMRSHYASDVSKKYYISGAPQCPLPDYMLNQAMTTSDFDFYFVQFYNNYCGVNAYGTGNFNFDAWDQFVKTQSGNRNAKVYLGVLGSSGGLSGYVSPNNVVSIAQALQSKYPGTFGGVSVWDAAQAWANGDFAGVVKQGLVSGGSVNPVSSSGTTKTLPTATTPTSSQVVSSSLQPTSGVVPSTHTTAASITITTAQPSSTSTATSTFADMANNNVAIYWGQNSVGQTNSQQNLAYYCQSNAVDIVLVSFLDVFFDTGGLPQINLGPSCDGPNFPGTDLLQCPAVGTDIQICQSLGKKVMLSLGGAAGLYGFTSAAQASQFADTVWNVFGGGTSATRPFGSAVLDGFDLDIEGGSNQFYDVFVNQMRTHYVSDLSKKYYISGAPQCPLPDYMLNQAMTSSDFDFFFVQFYNNYCGMGAYGTSNFNFDAWDQFAKTQSKNPNAKVYLGVPGSSSAAGSGYVNAAQVVSVAQALQSKYSSFGGVSIWDASQAWANSNFAGVVKQGLGSGSSGASSSSTLSTSTSFKTTSSLATTSPSKTRMTTTGQAVSTSNTASVTTTYSGTTATATSATATGTFSPSANTNVAVYWGQNSAGQVGSQQNLAYYCQSDATDIVLVSFLNVFFDQGGLPSINLGPSCGGPVFPGTDLLQCPAVGTDIQTCQKLGKKVLLSLGGAAGSYGFTSSSQASQFADTLWNVFGGGVSSNRPFGAAIVDGFDLDIEGGSNQYYDVFVTQMRTHYASDLSKKYYISGAPQCPLPDYMLNSAMTSSDFDFIFVQFYNNYCGMGAYGTSNFNFDAWDQFAKTQSKNPNAKVYLGVPGSASAAGSGYVNAAQVVSVAQALQSKYTSFGGVSIWDASQAWTNNNFALTVKQGLGPKLLDGAQVAPQLLSASQSETYRKSTIHFAVSTPSSLASAAHSLITSHAAIVSAAGSTYGKSTIHSAVSTSSSLALAAHSLITSHAAIVSAAGSSTTPQTSHPVATSTLRLSSATFKASSAKASSYAATVQTTRDKSTGPWTHFTSGTAKLSGPSTSSK